MLGKTNAVSGGGSSVSLPEYMSASNFTFNGNVCTGYTGGETDFVIAPKSYSIAGSTTTYQAYNNSSGNILLVMRKDGMIAGTFISADGSVEKTYTSQAEYNSNFGSDFPDGALLKSISSSSSDERALREWAMEARRSLTEPISCNGVEYIDAMEFEEAIMMGELTPPLDFEHVKTIYIDGSDINVTSISGKGFRNIGTLILQDNITTLENYALQDSEVKNIVLSETTTIEPLAFRQSGSLQTIPLVDTRNITDMSGMFQQCYALKSIPLLNTSKVTNMSSMFSFCTSLKTIPQLDTSKVTDMSGMFVNCGALQMIPQLNTSNVTSMGSMFQLCSALKTIPQLDTSNVTDMGHMFTSCTSLKTIPQLDTSSVTTMWYMFRSCTSLEEIPLLDMINVTNTMVMLEGCKNLTNLTLKNIKVDLEIGYGTSYGQLLTLDSLINTVKELWDLSSGTGQKLTMGTTNLAKIANIYVKLVTATAEQIAEDPNINNKKPCEVCESTDEGAMTLTAYAGLKNWTLAQY